MTLDVRTMSARRAVLRATLSGCTLAATGAVPVDLADPLELPSSRRLDTAGHSGWPPNEAYPLIPTVFDFVWPSSGYSAALQWLAGMTTRVRGFSVAAYYFALYRDTSHRPSWGWSDPANPARRIMFWWGYAFISYQHYGFEDYSWLCQVTAPGPDGIGGTMEHSVRFCTELGKPLCTCQPWLAPVGWGIDKQTYGNYEVDSIGRPTIVMVNRWPELYDYAQSTVRRCNAYQQFG